MTDSSDDLVHSHGEAEHEKIASALDIEQLDTNLYRSKSLWLPSEARGVFGGYVGLLIALSFGLYSIWLDLLDNRAFRACLSSRCLPA